MARTRVSRALARGVTFITLSDTLTSTPLVTMVKVLHDDWWAHVATHRYIYTSRRSNGVRAHNFRAIRRVPVDRVIVRVSG